MSFSELANKRQSTRKYSDREISSEDLRAIFEAARLSPSACNGQPYRVSVCRNEKKEAVARACMGMGMNLFLGDAPVMIVISEADYNKTAAFGAKIKHNDYRSIDIGILAAHITLAAADLDLGTCIIGWFDNKKIKEIIGTERDARLVIALGYPKEEKPPREKKRKTLDEVFTKM